LAALALVTLADCALGPVLFGLREYRGEPHRMQSVAVVDGVEFFDDSKGTNVGATVAALTGLGAERRLVVILGGDGKGQDFAPLAAPLVAHARAVVLIGRDAGLIRSAIAHNGTLQILGADSLPQAVERAAKQARSGDAVLLSPACASFDMFDDYAHRARVFVDAVGALAQRSGNLLEATA
jgi:UDP-N-acetylmuramoylalanine--D-glutamate ligase